jgi:hypothetical protein
MSKEAIKYYEKHRVIGDYLDKKSVISMMNGFHRQEQAKQLTLSGVVGSKFLCGKEKQHPLKRCEEQCGFCEGDK